MIPRHAARLVSTSAPTCRWNNAIRTTRRFNRASEVAATNHARPASIRLLSTTKVYRAEIGSKNNTTPESQPGPRLDASDPSNPVPKSPEDPASANEEFQGPKDADLNSEPLQPLPDLRHGIPSSFDATSADSASDDASASLRPGSPRPRDDQAYSEQNYRASDYETSTDRRRAKLANYMYIGLAATALLSSVYMARPYGSDETAPDGLDPSALAGWSPGAVWTRVKARSWGTVGQFAEPAEKTLLPPPLPTIVDEATGMVTPGDPEHVLVMSLDDLLVHTSWSREHGYRFAKRPGLDAFLQYVLSYYELVLYSSALEMNGRPIMEKLDPYHFFADKFLFRDYTRYDNGDHVKDLSYLGRPLDKVILIDTKASHAKFQPENAIILPKWNGDAKDAHAGDLLGLIPLLQYAAEAKTDVRRVLSSFKPTGACTSVAQEFAKREVALREKAKTDPKARSAVRTIDQRRAAGREKFDRLVALIAESGEANLQAERELRAADLEMQVKEAKRAYLGWIPGYSYLAGGDAPSPPPAGAGR